jgi:hypothetical protein
MVSSPHLDSFPSLVHRFESSLTYQKPPTVAPPVFFLALLAGFAREFFLFHRLQPLADARGFVK